MTFADYTDILDQAFAHRVHKLFDTLVSNLAGDDEDGCISRFKRGLDLALRARSLALDCIEPVDLLEESEDGNPSS